jgi:hypothetical protein
MDRTPEDRVLGILRITVGSVEKEVPTLPLRPAREWQRLVTAESGGFGLPPLRDWANDDVGRFSNLTVDKLLDLVIAYDRSGALGGRDWLEENADPAQLYAAAEAMADNAFPFGNARTLLAGIVTQALVPLAQPNSTNGHSRSGTSTPGRSKKPSTGSS